MPLLLTFPTPLQTRSGVDLPAVYVILEESKFRNRAKEVSCIVEYHVSEATYDAGRLPLDLADYPTRIGVRATAEQINNTPMLQALEQVLVAQLQRILPKDASIAVL
jgi:hypothetical protein